MTTLLPADHQRAGRRFGIRVVLLGVALFLVAVPFSVLILLVRTNWGPLHRLDITAADDLHTWALRSPSFVHVMQVWTDTGGPGPMRTAGALLVVALLLRRSWRLAAYVTVTLVLAAMLSGLLKQWVGRDRPRFEVAVSHAPGGSFPSGHALTSIVVVGLVLLVGLPLVARPWWPALIAVGAVVVATIGFTRIALGVHYVSDVIGGWTIGIACLCATTAAFHAWQHEAPSATEDDRIAVPASPASS